MKVLFIGGTGTISSACTNLAVEKGMDIYILNRGQTKYRSIPDSIKQIHADIRDESKMIDLLDGLVFDVVVDWVAYTKDHVQMDYRLFKKRVGHFIFISSASAYQTPPSNLPVTESTVLDNPYWEYSQEKIKCEDFLVRTYQTEKFPMTIVRPSHTYDQTRLPVQGRYTVIDRMRRGKKVIVHGDGTSLWVLTHAKDFAKGFVGLLGNSHAIGEAVHITSDQVLNWNQIYQQLAYAFGLEEPKLIHVPSELIAKFDHAWGASLLGDKANSMIFDNSKIKRLVPGYQAEIPFSVGVKDVVNWFEADPERRVVDDAFNHLCDTIIDKMERIVP